MVKELKDREEKRNSFSRRRRFHEEKDIDSINDRNEHFNKKIERAFGKYTLEIKNNLERGTALPDWGTWQLWHLRYFAMKIFWFACVWLLVVGLIVQFDIWPS